MVTLAITGVSVVGGPLMAAVVVTSSYPVEMWTGVLAAPDHSRACKDAGHG